jgi:phage I-like protein
MASLALMAGGAISFSLGGIMPWQVRTNVDSVEIGSMFIAASGTTVTISDEQYEALSPNAFGNGSDLTLVGQIADSGDAVSVQAPHVAPAAALTAPADLGATYTQANVNALRTDVAALQSKLNAVLSALQLPNGPMASS